MNKCYIALVFNAVWEFLNWSLSVKHTQLQDREQNHGTLRCDWCVFAVCSTSSTVPGTPSEALASTAPSCHAKCTSLRSWWRRRWARWWTRWAACGSFPWWPPAAPSWASWRPASSSSTRGPADRATGRRASRRRRWRHLVTMASQRSPASSSSLAKVPQLQPAKWSANPHCECDQRLTFPTDGHQLEQLARVGGRRAFLLVFVRLTVFGLVLRVSGLHLRATRGRLWAELFRESERVSLAVHHMHFPCTFSF